MISIILKQSVVTPCIRKTRKSNSQRNFYPSFLIPYSTVSYDAKNVQNLHIKSDYAVFLWYILAENPSYASYASC